MNSKKSRSRKKGNNNSNKLTIVLFLIYLLALGWILLFKLGVHFSYMGHRAVNLIPFREAFSLERKTNFPELIMNMLIFFPLGIYAGILFPGRKFAKYAGLFCCTSFVLESIQVIFKIGAFDITDVITNTFGAILGLWLYKVTVRKLKSEWRAQKFINILAAIGTGVMLLLLLLLKTNHLGIRYQ
jgi:glycopeptide antibiotics resistance protein